MYEIIGLIAALVGDAILLFLGVYFIITLSDLECDYINASKCCERLNWWTAPDLAGHGVLALMLLFTMHPFLFLFNIPLVGWHVYRYISKPSGSIGLYDPTEIHNRHNLKDYMKESMIKMGTHLVYFFIYLYCLISTLIS